MKTNPAIFLAILLLFCLPIQAEVTSVAYQVWQGLSTDAKPTAGVDAGGRFHEFDTRTWYVFDGTNWHREAQAVGSPQVSLAFTPTLSTSPAYAEYDAMGAKNSLSNAVRPGTLSGLIQSIEISNLDDDETPDIDVCVFRDDPSGTTATDNAALDIADADLPKLIKCFPIASADYKAFNTTDNSHAAVSNLAYPFVAASTTLYAILVARGAFTPGSTTDLTVRINILQN